MNNLIIHKIVKYVNKTKIAKLFFYFSDYRSLINTSNSHFDELYDLYGNHSWHKITNNIRSVQAMFRLKIYYYFLPINHAAKNGCLDVVKWIYNEYKKTLNLTDNGKLVIQHAIEITAARGNLEIIKWLYENIQIDKKIYLNMSLNINYNICRPKAMDLAAQNGHFEIVKWLYENHKGLFESSINSAICTYQAMDGAATNGHFEIVKWLYENQKELLMNPTKTIYTINTINMAAKKGHLEMVKWLYEKNIRSKWAIHYAASEGHLETVKWLYDIYFLQQPIIDVDIYQVINWAVMSGHLNVVEWLMQMRTKVNNKVPPNGICSQDALDAAIMRGHKEVIEWIYKNQVTK